MVNECLPSVMDERVEERQTEGKRSEALKKCDQFTGFRVEILLKVLLIFLLLFFKFAKHGDEEEQREGVRGKEK